MGSGLWFVVVFSLVIGVAIPLFWVSALASGNVPEVSEGRKEIWFHIGAEISTGLALIIGGFTTWASPDSDWTTMVSCLSLGMLLYTATVSPGYYVDRAELPMVAMFGVVWVGAVAAFAVRLVA